MDEEDTALLIASLLGLLYLLLLTDEKVVNIAIIAVALVFATVLKAVVVMLISIDISTTADFGSAINNFALIFFIFPCYQTHNIKT